jgi:hypothetical protein
MPSARRDWAVRLLIVAAILVAYFLGTLRPTVQLHTGTGYAAEGAISVEADGWTYSIPRDDMVWIDQQGSWHDAGRPSCLPIGSVTVKFAAVEVHVQDSTWRQVVWVDCR